MAELYKRARSPFWQARLFVGDQVKRLSTKERNRRKAQKEADDKEREENELIKQGGGLTLLAAAAIFLGRPVLGEHTVETYKSALTNIYGVLGDFSLSRLTEREIDRYVKSRLKSVKSGTILGDLAFLSSLMTKAKHYDGGPTRNIVKEYDRDGLEPAEERNTWLRETDIERLIDACYQEYQKIFIRLAVETGMRKAEVLKLTWAEVDLDDRLIYLGNLDRRRTKNKTGRIIPITDAAHSAFLSAQKLGSKVWGFGEP